MRTNGFLIILFFAFVPLLVILVFSVVCTTVISILNQLRMYKFDSDYAQ